MTLDAQITDLERRRAELVGQLASVGQMRPGSLTLRFRRCGTAGCHCAKPGDTGHGPEWAHSRFPGHALTPTGVMAIRCKQFHLPDL